MRMQLIWQSATLPRWRQRVRAPSSAPIKTLVSQVLFYSQQIDNLICIFESLQTETKATITKWEHSSAGRASALQAEGHRFESYCSHHLARQFSWLERQPVTLEVDGSNPFRVAIFLPLQLSRQSRGLKIPVSMVRFRPEAPKMRMQLIWQSATLPRWRQRVRAPSSAPKESTCQQTGAFAF